MFLIIAGLAGFLAALFIHWLTWTVRLKYPSVTIVLGALGALGLTWFCLLFLNSDIANMMRVVLVIFWAVALLLGGLQAFGLRIPWWRGVPGVFFEMALAFLTGAAFNLTLQGYIEWFNENFPGVDVYAVINSFLWTMIVALLVLAIVRPLVLLRQARPEETIYTSPLRTPTHASVSDKHNHLRFNTRRDHRQGDGDHFLRIPRQR